MIPFTRVDFVAIFLCTRSIRVNTQGTNHYGKARKSPGDFVSADLNCKKKEKK